MNTKTCPNPQIKRKRVPVNLLELHEPYKAGIILARTNLEIQTVQ
jgi:hypothetical protein